MSARRVPRLVVAMDGPAGSGKSSVSRRIAAVLGLRYLDTGAMYRGLTWWMLREAVDVGDCAAVAASARKPVIDVGTDPAAPVIAVDGEDVSTAIRTAAVTGAVSAVSAVSEVRHRLVRMQREIIDGAGSGIVVEGRDIGAVVAPDAAVKMYLTASADARAHRRSAEDAGRGEARGAASWQATRAQLARRDHLDSSRSSSPLTRAPDAVELDTTGLSMDEVVAAVLGRVHDVAGVAATGGDRTR